MSHYSKGANQKPQPHVHVHEQLEEDDILKDSVMVECEMNTNTNSNTKTNTNTNSNTTNVNVNTTTTTGSTEFVTMNKSNDVIIQGTSEYDIDIDSNNEKGNHKEVEEEEEGETIVFAGTSTFSVDLEDIIDGITDPNTQENERDMANPSVLFDAIESKLDPPGIQLDDYKDITTTHTTTNTATTRDKDSDNINYQAESKGDNQEVTTTTNDNELDNVSKFISMVNSSLLETLDMIDLDDDMLKQIVKHTGVESDGGDESPVEMTTSTTVTGLDDCDVSKLEKKEHLRNDIQRPSTTPVTFTSPELMTTTIHPETNDSSPTQSLLNDTKNINITSSPVCMETDNIANVSSEDLHASETSKSLDFGPSPGCFTRIGQQLYDNNDNESEGTKSSLKEEDEGTTAPLLNTNQHDTSQSRSQRRISFLSLFFFVVIACIGTFIHYSGENYTYTNDATLDEAENNCHLTLEEQQDFCAHFHDVTVENETIVEDDINPTSTYAYEYAYHPWVNKFNNEFVWVGHFILGVSLPIALLMIYSFLSRPSKPSKASKSSLKKSKVRFQTPFKSKRKTNSSDRNRNPRNLLSPRELANLDKSRIFLSRFRFELITKRGELKTVVRSARISPFKSPPKY